MKNLFYQLIKLHQTSITTQLQKQDQAAKLTEKTSVATKKKYYFYPLAKAHLPATTANIHWHEHHLSIFQDTDKQQENSPYHFTISGTKQGSPIKFHFYFNKAGNVVSIQADKNTTLAFEDLPKTTQQQITAYAIQAGTQFTQSLWAVQQTEKNLLLEKYVEEEKTLSDIILQAHGDQATTVSQKALTQAWKTCSRTLEALIAIDENPTHWQAQRKLLQSMVEKTKTHLTKQRDVSSPRETVLNPETPSISPTPHRQTPSASNTSASNAQRLAKIKEPIKALEAITNIEKTPRNLQALNKAYNEAIELCGPQDIEFQFHVFQQLNKLPRMAETLFGIHVQQGNHQQAQDFLAHIKDTLRLPVLIKAIITAIKNDDDKMLTMLYQQTHFPLDYLLTETDGVDKKLTMLPLKAFAAAQGKNKALEALLKLGANTNAPVYGMGLPFPAWLAKEGYSKALGIAGSYGANVNAIYSSVTTETETKAASGISRQERRVLQRQKTVLTMVNQVGGIDHGHSMLSLTALQGQFDACLVLLDLGAKKDHRNNKGSTQISNVCNGSSAAMPFLLMALPGEAAKAYTQAYQHAQQTYLGIEKQYTQQEAIKQLLALIELYQRLLPAYPGHKDQGKAIYNMATILKICHDIQHKKNIFSPDQCKAMDTHAKTINDFIKENPAIEDIDIIRENISVVLKSPFLVIEENKDSSSSILTQNKDSVHQEPIHPQALPPIHRKPPPTIKPIKEVEKNDISQAKFNEAELPKLGSNTSAFFSASCTKTAILAVATGVVIGGTVLATMNSDNDGSFFNP